ncbi:MAG: serine/threonine protein kinase, partial [Desulfamplus sp.]|nr:serine/threonine protein kinase [Desulfamplus sp.]
MISDTLLMFDLTQSEEQLVKRLLTSFEINLEFFRKIDFKAAPDFFNTKDICLVIIHVDHDITKDIDNIRSIKKLLPIQVPLLILLSSEFVSHIQSCIKAGADDYIVMPLNDESFAMRFYVLLECGQAILETRRLETRQSKWIDIEPEKALSQKNRDTWRLIVGYLQEGLSFFAPKYQLARRGGRPIFNKWKPIRKLATGGDGVIWLVQELGTDRLAVAKIPHSPQMNINSLRAAAILKRLLYHPNIVQLIELVKDDEKFILIQEYVEGITLWELLVTTTLSSQKRESIFLQLLSVIAYSHDHKIMHRDIKPDNIMVTSDDKLKLLDFGSAKEINWIDRNNSPEGTLNFMSPEQLEGKTCLASDVWALGVILYLLTVNRLPFYQDNSCYPMDIDTDMIAVPPRKIRVDIPVQLEQIIMRCLEKDIQRRYTNAVKLRDDLLMKLPDFGNGM